jgi:hypothetical protein
MKSLKETLTTLSVQRASRGVFTTKQYFFDWCRVVSSVRRSNWETLREIILFAFGEVERKIRKNYYFFPDEREEHRTQN